MQHYFRDQKSIDELSSVLRALRELTDGDEDDEALSDRLLDEFHRAAGHLGQGLR